jgi:transposase
MNELDLSFIYARYERSDGRGLAAYHPVLMARLLLYGYCIGITSSRKIEQATYDNVAFRYLSADQHPDHDTLAAFRQEHVEALAELFVQALRLCQKARLVVRERRDKPAHCRGCKSPTGKEKRLHLGLESCL